jgi:hypothetical protein
MMKKRWRRTMICACAEEFGWHILTRSMEVMIGISGNENLGEILC